MLPQHIFNAALGIEAIDGFEQQFTDSVGITVSAGLFELFQQLFIELFARSQAGELDLDIAIRVVFILHLEAAEADHTARHVEDAHRLAHVEHEDIAARQVPKILLLIASMGLRSTMGTCL